MRPSDIEPSAYIHICIHTYQVHVYGVYMECTRVYGGVSIYKYAHVHNIELRCRYILVCLV